MADTFSSLSSDLPSVVWAFLVVGVILGTALILHSFWELVFKLAGLVRGRLVAKRAQATHQDVLSQHRR